MFHELCMPIRKVCAPYDPYRQPAPQHESHKPLSMGLVTALWHRYPGSAPLEILKTIFHVGRAVCAAAHLPSVRALDVFVPRLATVV
jgi:hypothetical protein